MSSKRVFIDAKSSCPAIPRSNRGLFSTPKSDHTSPSSDSKDGTTPWLPNQGHDLVSPLESAPSSPGVAIPVSPETKHPMAWDDPPKSSASWHNDAEEMGDLGRATPRKDDSLHQGSIAGPVSGKSPLGRNGNLAVGPDQMDDDDMLYKRFSKSSYSATWSQS